MPSVSLAQLALRTNLSKAEILTHLTSLPVLSRLRPEEPFSEADAAEIVRALRPLGDGRELRWLLSPGDRVLRADLHLAYGGSRQDGIVTFTQFSDIVAFTDPRSGARHGYDALEGLLPDGSYSYTGAGSVGPQVFKRGNRALAEAAEAGRRVRLFRQESPYATYVGEYTTGSPAYRIEDIPDSTGATRPGIIFNLVPINADPRVVATDGILERPAKAIHWTPLNYSDVEGTAEVVLPSGRRISRDEFKLQTQFGSWIADQGHAVRRLLLPVDGVTIEPDLFVESQRWVVEAKRSASRRDVRTAVGQSLDYAHVARRHGIDAQPMVLLPGPPTDSLTSLVRETGVFLAMRAERGFSVLAPESA